MTASLDGVLVVTVRKSFWASPQADLFPRKLFARVFVGHSTHVVNSLAVFARALLAVWRARPRIVLLGSVERTVPWFIRARRLGLLRGARLVVTNQYHLDDAQLEQVDRNVVYSSAWIGRQRAEVRRRAVFVHLPADGDFDAARRVAPTDGYVFSGGGAGRDFPTLIEALRDTDARLEIVTFSPGTLGWSAALPANCVVRWRMPVPDFLARLAGCAVAAVPLRDPDSDFGQTTVVQALSLGKPVVATRSPSLADYVTDGVEGLLVDAGDVAGWRESVLRLLRDPALRAACERAAREKASELTYDAFAARLAALCGELGA
jgi:glycosyltransferase involved in cell wall biosynthesis